MTLETEFFTCKTCGKCFSKFQALGGHRASHIKKNNINNKNNADMAVGSVSVTSHDCSICGKKFLSGQSLGGHMRKHRNAAPEKNNFLKEINVNGKSGCDSSVVHDRIVTLDLFPRESIKTIKALALVEDLIVPSHWLDLKLGF